MTRIRDEHQGDADAVDRLHRAAFGAQGAAVAAIVADLRPAVAAGRGFCLVADVDGEPVGHVMVTPSLLDAPDRLVDVRVLSPLAVRADRRRRGVGGSLVRAALQRLATSDVPLVFLEGSPDYYGRFGFVAAGPLGFRRPSLRIPPAAFQVVRLPAWRPRMTGTLVYPQVFWDHDAVGLRDTAP